MKSEERFEESQDMIAKYPDRVPARQLQSNLGLVDLSLYMMSCVGLVILLTVSVVVERYSKTDLPAMEKKRYLLPRDMSVGQFIHILSSRLHLAPGKALFVFMKNTLPQTSSLMESVYESFKDEDRFLYMCYSSKKTFGGGDFQICGHTW